MREKVYILIMYYHIYMVKIRSYFDIEVNLLRHTEFPDEVIAKACQMNTGNEIKSAHALISFLKIANHTSPFEHVYYTFEITGITRALMGQITRHRMASYSMTSQHYQDYRDYPVSRGPAENYYDDCWNEIVGKYQEALDNGMSKEEARMILPNAMTVNFIWTINARSLMNFFQQRMCKRNTKEMQIFADKIFKVVWNAHPYIWSGVGPVCYETGKCNQGRMSCGSHYIRGL